MAYEVNFGSIRVNKSKATAKKSGRFRLAVLGDFSARANNGKLDTGAALSTRKPMKVDCDNLDATLKRLAVRLRLPLGPGGGTVELPVRSMDDLHPDQLVNSLPIFSELSALRQRLQSPSTFAKAAKEVQSWAGVTVSCPPPVRARSTNILVDAKLSDFARLVGVPTVPVPTPSTTGTIAELLKNVVGPYIVPAKDPRQDQLVAMMDSALAATMRLVLHHPDFQAFESLWRSVDMLVRRLESDEQLQIVLYDITAEEFAADLSGADGLENSGLNKLLVEQPALDAAQGPLSVVLGNFTFEQTPPHAELLGRIARILGQTQTAFIAGVGPGCIDTKPADQHPLVREAWDALAAIPEGRYVALATPRFLLRMPYGKDTDPIDSFKFEEFTPQAGLSGMLWGNPAVIAGLLLGATFTQQGPQMQPGSVLSLDDMPFYWYTDSDGDQTALPCTERMLSSRMAALVGDHRFMPLLSIKGQPEVRLGGFRSVTGEPLAGSWKPVTEAAPVPEELPEPEPTETTDETEEPAAAQAEESPAPAGTDSSSETTALESETTAEQQADPELDTLLAKLDEETAPTPSPAEPTGTNAEAEPELDPELARLLKELG